MLKISQHQLARKLSKLFSQSNAPIQDEIEQHYILQLFTSGNYKGISVAGNQSNRNKKKYVTENDQSWLAIRTLEKLKSCLAVGWNVVNKLKSYSQKLYLLDYLLKHFNASQWNEMANGINELVHVKHTTLQILVLLPSDIQQRFAELEEKNVLNGPLVIESLIMSENISEVQYIYQKIPKAKVCSHFCDIFFRVSNVFFFFDWAER